ncbi:hypothetical protein Tco_1045109 [Tanacetum coccineum]|uniref:Integrase, catalytic region, zinc finger, CCHC-type, peptidase aspartic, catalytic n=1 Tax=Tanacetum coccineum TaxID=301880 RepID=A0ABQ5GSD2_9ASTR
MSLSLAKNVIVARVVNRPPMLDKTNYSSWASRMLLYIKGKEHGKLLIWDRVKLLIQGSELSFQECESKLYNDFDMFTSSPGDLIHSYYMWFSQLINDIHTIGMTMQPLQVNIKFVNHLQPEWRKFVMDVKLVKYMHSTIFDHLYAHIWQHEAHAIEVRLTRQRYPDQIALLDSGLAVPSNNPSDDPIASLNKEMAFLSTSFASRFSQINNQLRTSSNPRNQATIQDGRVTV